MQQQPQPEIDRLADPRQTAKVAIEEERREVTEGPARVAAPRRRQQLVRNERSLRGQTNGAIARGRRGNGDSWHGRQSPRDAGRRSSRLV